MDWLIDICLWFLYYFGITLGTLVVAVIWIAILAVIWHEVKEIITEVRHPSQPNELDEYLKEY